jgi:predicted RNA binding protein YcfA (HicA-like mRNA interferase family)
MKYREVAKKLIKLGCQELPRRGKGSHRLWFNPTQNLTAPLPDWGAKDIKMGTLRAVVKQLGIAWEEFQKG